MWDYETSHGHETHRERARAASERPRGVRAPARGARSVTRAVLGLCVIARACAGA